MIATNAFTEKDLQIFTGIAAQAAVAIQNARLAKKIETRGARRARSSSACLSPNLVEQVVAGQAAPREGRRAARGDACCSRTSAASRRCARRASRQEIVQHAQRVLRGDGRRAVQVRRARSTSSSATRSSALFGAPVDDAGRAAQGGALRARHACRRCASSTARAPPRARSRSRIGIGINTGQRRSPARSARSRALQYTAIGDAVNTASRLCSSPSRARSSCPSRRMRRVAQHVDAVTAGAGAAQGQRERAAGLQRRRHEGRRMAPRTNAPDVD